MEMHVATLKQSKTRQLLTDEQLRIIADILANLGHISLGSVALPYLIPSVSSGAIQGTILGSLLSLFFWSLSILSVKRIH